jgi:hypothetical protein
MLLILFAHHNPKKFQTLFCPVLQYEDVLKICTLKSKNKDFVFSSTAMVERTASTDAAQQSIFIRGIDKDFHIVQ